MCPNSRYLFTPSSNRQRGKQGRAGHRKAVSLFIYSRIDSSEASDNAKFVNKRTKQRRHQRQGLRHQCLARQCPTKENENCDEGRDLKEARPPTSASVLLSRSGTHWTPDVRECFKLPVEGRARCKRGRCSLGQKTNLSDSISVLSHCVSFFLDSERHPRKVTEMDGLPKSYPLFTRP